MSHAILGATDNSLGNIKRDLKRHTSEKLYLAINNKSNENKRVWLLWHMERAAAKNANSEKFQLLQSESRPIELTTPKMKNKKLNIDIIIKYWLGL